MDEYDHYCQVYNGEPDRLNNTAPVEVDILQWWKDHESVYPNLSRMAYDSLSIPAMSAECERVFSSTKRLIDDDRGRLNAETIEACQCNKYWMEHSYGN
jgi:hypothetical protein